MKLEVNFKNYLDNTDLVPVSYEDLGSDGYRITFNNEVTQEQFERIKEFLHIKLEVMISIEQKNGGYECIPSENYIFLNGNVISIRIPHFRIFYNVYELIKSFGVKIHGVSISKQSISYFYKLKGRTVLNYDELELVQNEVNPYIKEHDSCRQMGFDSTYTLNLRLDKR